MCIRPSKDVFQIVPKVYSHIRANSESQIFAAANSRSSAVLTKLLPGVAFLNIVFSVAFLPECAQLPGISQEHSSSLLVLVSPPVRSCGIENRILFVDVRFRYYLNAFVNPYRVARNTEKERSTNSDTTSNDDTEQCTGR